MTTNASTLLKYANVQMAAEARLDLFLNQASEAALKFGNDRSSRFTTVQAAEFATDWKVVEHKSNTSTGFSGTLFECLTDDAARGLKKGELVLSFRSTEFADDSVRDNQATNGMEVNTHGWAFGQIADMQNWFNDLRGHNLVPQDKKVSVTGYSLGGHLATAFALLHPGDVAATYTFNGAGVGDITPGQNLYSIINTFDRQRRNESGYEISFSNSALQTKYNELRGRQKLALQSGMSTITEQDINDVRAMVFLTPQALAEQTQLIEALKRVQLVEFERVRVASITNSGTLPLKINAPAIEALSLDYQMAIVLAGEKTYATNAGLAAGVSGTLGTRNHQNGILPNFYDVFGAPLPSAVSNSQIHYGQDTPVWIEDQPLLRGSIAGKVYAASSAANGIKLLVDDFSNNDFGDTHSLVLMVDSLAVQQTISTIDKTLDNSAINRLLQSSSNLTGTSSIGSQGKAEGDALENVVNDLARLFDRPAILKGDPRGGTWYELDDRGGYTGRNSLHNQLSQINGYLKDNQLEGKFSIQPAHDASLARTDFAAALSLITGSRYSLRLKDASDSATENKLYALYRTEYEGWLADKNASQLGQPILTYTDNYLNDRSAYLNRLIQANIKNTPASDSGIMTIRTTNTQNTDYIDLVNDRQVSIRPAGSLVQSAAQRVIFGNSNANEINGATENDRLYGGSGTDTLDGKAGNDYLEGGAGADTLTGGAGDDVLLGGRDTDTYKFDGLWGNDTITDADGLGQILINGQQLASISAGAVAIGAGLWESQDKRFIFNLLPATAGQAARLIIGQRTSAGAGAVHATLSINDWRREQSDCNDRKSRRSSRNSKNIIHRKVSCRTLKFKAFLASSTHADSIVCYGNRSFLCRSELMSRSTGRFSGACHARGVLA
jgi:Ca2+-binding RTX toxin-like protein